MVAVVAVVAAIETAAVTMMVLGIRRKFSATVTTWQRRCRALSLMMGAEIKDIAETHRGENN